MTHANAHYAAQTHTAAGWEARPGRGTQPLGGACRGAHSHTHSRHRQDSRPGPSPAAQEAGGQEAGWEAAQEAAGAAAATATATATATAKTTTTCCAAASTPRPTLSSPRLPAGHGGPLVRRREGGEVHTLLVPLLRPIRGRRHGRLSPAPCRAEEGEGVLSPGPCCRLPAG